MNRFAISEQYDPEIPLLLRNKHPTAHAPIRLHEFGVRLPNRRLDPCVQNPRAIRALSRVPKVFRCLQDTRNLVTLYN